MNTSQNGERIRTADILNETQERPPKKTGIPIQGNSQADFDDPQLFLKLSQAEQYALKLWIDLCLKAAPKPCSMSSYGLKHLYEADMNLYATNGEFKGAMIAAGYTPVDAWQRNWHFRLRLAGVRGQSPRKISAAVSQQLKAASDQVNAVLRPVQILSID